ncbi:MAG: NAD(P)/FAD-dependent oxidoreductase [Actinomycetota bacterium]
MRKPVVVIGGGIVGTAIAYELQKAGAETILVERDIQPQGASAFSFASLSAFDEPQRDVYLLKSHGMVAWRQWAKEFGDELGVRFPGELRWAESNEAAGHLTSLIERATARGYPVHWASNEEVKKHEPAGRPGAILAASFAPQDGQGDPLRGIDVLQGAFAESGGTIAVGRASLIIEESGVTVRVGNDRVEASTVVIAAGAETTALLERLAWEIPMDPSPGLLAVTEPVEPFLVGTVYVYPKGDTPVHLRQRADGRVIIGERAQDEVAKNPTMEHARLLLREAYRSFPALEATGVDHFTVEWRPMPRDKMPIVGPLPGLSSLYVATGHSGVTIAPALGQFITKEIIDGVEQDRLRPFRPARFSANRADAYLSIEEAFAPPSEIFLG